MKRLLTVKRRAKKEEKEEKEEEEEHTSSLPCSDPQSCKPLE